MSENSLNDYIWKLRETLMAISVDAGSYAEGAGEPEFSQFLDLEARIRKVASEAQPQAQSGEISVNDAFNKHISGSASF